MNFSIRGKRSWHQTLDCSQQRSHGELGVLVHHLAQADIFRKAAARTDRRSDIGPAINIYVNEAALQVKASAYFEALDHGSTLSRQLRFAQLRLFDLPVSQQCHRKQLADDHQSADKQQ